MTRRQRIGLWAVLGGALLLRVLLVLSLESKPFFYTPIVDGAAYDRWAQEIAAGDVAGKRAFYQDPLYPYGLGMFYALYGRDLLAARLVQCLIGTLGLWMLFEATRRWRGYRTAMIALVLAATYKTFVFYDAMLLKDFLAVVAVEGALLFASLESRWKWLAFGAALGVGTLVRGNMLLVAFAATAFMLLRRQWKPAAAIALGTAACILPVTIRNAVVAHDFVLTTAQLGPNLYTGNNPENTSGRYRPPSFVAVASPDFEEAGFRAEAERMRGRPLKSSEVDAFWRGRATQWIRDEFGTFLIVTGKRALMLLSAYEIPDDVDPYFMRRFSWVLHLPMATFSIVAPLGVAGIVLSRRERGRFTLLYLFLAAYALSIIVFFVFARYRLPIVPVLIFFAAHAIAVAIDSWRSFPRPALAAGVIGLIAVHWPWPASVVGHRDFRTAHYNLGIYYAQTQKPAEAAREFEAAGRLNAEYYKMPGFVMALADAHERAGHDPEALELCIRAAALDPRWAEPLVHAGTIYLRSGLYEKAAEQLAHAIRRDPSFLPAHLGLAEAYVKLRRFDTALECLQRNAPEVHLKRAEIYLQMSMKKEAREAAGEALKLRPGDRGAKAILEGQ